MNVVRTAIDGSHAHNPCFIYLETQVRAVQVLFYHLRGMQVIACPLIFGVFLESIILLEGVHFFLLVLEHAVEVDKCFLLLFQLHLLHKPDTLAPCFKSFRIEYLDAVNLYLRFAVISALKRFAGCPEFLACFFLHIAAREERAAEARKEHCFLHNFHS